MVHAILKVLFVTLVVTATTCAAQMNGAFAAMASNCLHIKLDCSQKQFRGQVTHEVEAVCHMCIHCLVTLLIYGCMLLQCKVGHNCTNRTLQCTLTPSPPYAVADEGLLAQGNSLLKMADDAISSGTGSLSVGPTSSSFVSGRLT